MTVVAKCIVESKYAENSQTTQYTASAGTRTIIDKFTAYNVSASAAVLTINTVASGGAAGSSNITASKSIASGETYTFPEVVGHVLNAGDFISTLASAASTIVIRIGGREVS